MQQTAKNRPWRFIIYIYYSASWPFVTYNGEYWGSSARERCLAKGPLVRKAFAAFFTALLFQFALLQPAAAQVRPAAPAVGVTPPGPAYRINPGDEIEVSVWGDERLQRTVRVLPD